LISSKLRNEKYVIENDLIYYRRAPSPFPSLFTLMKIRIFHKFDLLAS
jgi:hypothetical protein